MSSEIEYGAQTSKLVFMLSPAPAVSSTRSSASNVSVTASRSYRYECDPLTTMTKLPVLLRTITGCDLVRGSGIPRLALSANQTARRSFAGAGGMSGGRDPPMLLQSFLGSKSNRGSASHRPQSRYHHRDLIANGSEDPRRIRSAGTAAQPCAGRIWPLEQARVKRPRAADD